jgi:MoaD family protein
MVKIQYLGQIRAIVDRREESIDPVQNKTILTILQRLATKYGKEFETEVLDDSKHALREGILVTINGRAIEQLDGLDTFLNDHDTIAILPLFTGGG